MFQRVAFKFFVSSFFVSSLVKWTAY